MCGFKKSTDAKEIREQENVNAANILGADIINLNYVDNQYETRSPSDISSLIEAITKDIEQIVGSMGKTQVTVIGPSYFGEKVTHPDHLVVSKALMQVVKNTCYGDVDFYFYEDLPYTIHKFGEEEITLDELLMDFYPGLILDKREILLSSQVFDLKMKGIKAYPSQIKAFDSMDEDIIAEITKYGMNRCPQSPLPQMPCEVVYRIE